MGHSRLLFLYFWLFSWQFTGNKWSINVCQWLDSNRRSLVPVVTALPLSHKHCPRIQTYNHLVRLTYSKVRVVISVTRILIKFANSIKITKVGKKIWLYTKYFKKWPKMGKVAKLGPIGCQSKLGETSEDFCRKIHRPSHRIFQIRLVNIMTLWGSWV